MTLTPFQRIQQWQGTTAPAQAMASQWYALAGRTPDPQGLAWWTKQIQQDGSNTAFKNFTVGIAKDTPAAGQVLAQNTQRLVAAGTPPWTPSTGAVNGQIPGTKMSNVSPAVSNAFQNVVKGGIAVGTAVGAAPLLAGALGGGAAGAVGAAGATGAAGKAVQSGLGDTSMTGTVMADGSVLPAGVSPLDTEAGQAAAAAAPTAPAAVADATSATGGLSGGSGIPGGVNSVLNGGGSGIPGAVGSTVAGKLPSLVQGAVNGASGGGAGGIGGGVLDFLGGNGGLNTLALAQGVNAAQLGAQAQQYASTAANDANSRWAAQAPLRSAGIAGMLNPTSPYTAPALPGGNPFAPAPVPSQSQVPPQTPAGVNGTLSISPRPPVSPVTPTPI